MGEIGHYLDTSLLVPFLMAEPASERAERFICGSAIPLIVSDFAAAEFASAISRRVRMRELPIAEGQAVLSAFDRWLSASVSPIEIAPADIAVAAGFMRRFDIALRTPDAIHIAVVQRVGAVLVTFDRAMAAAATALGAAVAEA